MRAFSLVSYTAVFTALNSLAAFGQELCSDGSEPQLKIHGQSYHVTYEAPLIQMRQPETLALGHTGAGTAVALIEKNIPSWFFEHEDGRPRPFGACLKPADAPPDHWGWAPESDPAFPEEPCKIGWVMCVAVDSNDRLVDPADSLQTCSAIVDGYNSNTDEPTSVHKGGHATNSSFGVVSVAPDTKIIAISMPSATLMPTRAAFRWLTTPGTGYLQRSTDSGPGQYIEGPDEPEWADYWSAEFGSQTPVEKFNIVVANLSYLVSDMHFNEVCEATNPLVPQDNADGDSRPDIQDNCIDVPNDTWVEIGTEEDSYIISQQIDGDQDGYGNACDGDLDNDGDGDFADVLLMSSIVNDFENFVPPFDINNDGLIDETDKLWFFNSVDFDWNHQVDADDVRYYSQHLWGKGTGRSYVDILPLYDEFRNPHKYIQDLLYAQGDIDQQSMAPFYSLTDEFARLRELGAIPIVAAGNNGYRNAVVAPACTEGAIVVTGVRPTTDLWLYNNYDWRTNTTGEGGGTIYINSSPELPVIAAHSKGETWERQNRSDPLGEPVPSCPVDPKTSGGGNGSWSTPTVSGAVAVLRGASVAPDATPDEIQLRLMQTERQARVNIDCTSVSPSQPPYDPEQFELHCPDTQFPGGTTSLIPGYSRPAIDLYTAVMYGPEKGAPDTDGDGIYDRFDNCVNIGNTEQKDSDGDGYGNACDADFNQDGKTDASDSNRFLYLYLESDNSHGDFNNDGYVDYLDSDIFENILFGHPPGPSGLDIDGDGRQNHLDNCIYEPNGPWTENIYGVVSRINQRDSDYDRIGDACDGDFDNNGIVDWLDGITLTSYFDLDGTRFPANEADFNSDGTVDLTDRAIFVEKFYAFPPKAPGPSGMCRLVKNMKGEVDCTFAEQ